MELDDGTRGDGRDRPERVVPPEVTLMLVDGANG
jgi:hypothetical protein